MEIDKVVKEVIDDGIINITFSNKFRKSYEYTKVNISKIEDYYQISNYTEKQVFHESIEHKHLEYVILNLFKDYKQMDGFTQNNSYNIRVNKKGNVLMRKNAMANSDKVNSHNRSKNYVLENYAEMEVLKDLGIISHDNQIISGMRDKFKQINKYVELVDDLIKNDNLEKLKIVDFGSGKSYLTFVLYEYLSKSKHLDVEMIGIDLKESVIKDNIKLADKYAFKNLKFIFGDINDIEINNVDMVISLHACDIATDLALNKALEWKSKYIVSVPCCQNELYTQLKSNKFSKMVDFNIIKECMSALITDTVRKCSSISWL